MTSCHKKIKAIILARGGSKGIPNKNIIDFCGKPLLSYTIEQAKNSKYIDEVYVSSDSDVILKVSEKYGATPIKRPGSISGDRASSESALIHFLDNYPDCETILFLQPTSPLRHTHDIDYAIDKYIKNNYDCLFSANKAEDLCVWAVDKGVYSSLTYDYKNRKRRQDISNLVLENGSFYIIDSEGFMKNNNRLFGKIGHYIMDPWKIHEIDSVLDLELCQFVYKRRIK
tara:strand:- start:2043 stop:2726 length:684 start_codon:yes stop_codon:yes gene_type:complete